MGKPKDGPLQPGETRIAPPGRKLWDPEEHCFAWVRPIGSILHVGIGPDSIEAQITEITILPGPCIRYRVVWWDGRIRRNEWMEALELGERKGPAAKIGFIRG